jgi:predicted nucleic acid-binding protein
MAVYYLDTSAILKRYRTEKGTDVVDALYDSVKPVADQAGGFRGLMDALRGSMSPGRSLHTSHFSCLEVESVAARTMSGKSVIDLPYQTLLASFASDLRDYLSLEQVDGEMVNYAIEMTRRTRLRPADSVHLASALALRARNESEELVVVASDKELLAAVQGAGIKTLDPEGDDAMEVLKGMK